METQITMHEMLGDDSNPEYDAFVEKFKPKLTTDDCYTPPLVYEAVAGWVEKTYGVDHGQFVRPFYPGGDYENYPYNSGDIVVDNPPFSIVSQIVKTYCKRGIRFLLFCPGTTGLCKGMRGETEAIEDLGIDVRAAALADYFGIPQTNWGYLDQQTRTLYTYQYILENTTVAQGDFVRTQDQYANQMRIFNENITQLKADLGEGLLPVMTELVTWFNTLFDSEESAEEVTQGIKDDFVATAVEITNTATAATALVNALAEFEKGGFTDEEKKQWDALVESLSTDLPLLNEAIGANNSVVEQGSAALAAYVEEWNKTSLEIGQASAMASYNEKIGAQQVETAQAQKDAEAAKAYAVETEKLWNQVWLDSINFVNRKFDPAFEGATAQDVEDVLNNPNFVRDYLFNLEEWGKGGDAQAQAYFDLLQGLTPADTAWAKYEEAQTKYEAESAELKSLQAQQEELLAAVNAIAEAMQSQEPPVVEVTVNNSTDEDVIVSKVEQRISRNAKSKSMVTGLVR